MMKTKKKVPSAMVIEMWPIDPSDRLRAQCPQVVSLCGGESRGVDPGIRLATAGRGGFVGCDCYRASSQDSGQEHWFDRVPGARRFRSQCGSDQSAPTGR